MRSELGVLLMEDQKGEVAVQLFAEIASVEGAFRNLAGSPADPAQRATLLSIRWTDGEVKVASLTKMLPVIESAENRPDGYVIGEGPVTFKKTESVS